MTVRTWSIRLLAGAALAIAATGLPAATAGAAPKQGKEYALDVESPQFAGVTDGSYTFTLTNLSGTQQIGSADVTVPSALTITDRNGIPGTGQVLELRNLALPASPPSAASVTFTVGLRMPCLAGGYDWTAVAKQSNDFAGPPGNTLGPVSGNRTTTVQGRCKLRFVNQPASAEKIANITADAFQPDSANVLSVETIDARPTGAQHTDSFNGNITMTSIPSALPSTTRTAVNGFATFPSLSIAESDNYVLHAADGSAIDAVDSNGFQVIDIVEDCNAASCSTGALAGPKSKATLTGDVDEGSGFALISLNLGTDPLLADGCVPYVAPSEDFFEFQLIGVAGAKSVLLEYTKEAMKRRSPASLEVCYAVPGPAGFTAKDGLAAEPFDFDGNPLTGPGGKEGFAALLPDCPATPTGPCVSDRSPIAGGGATITAFDPTLGDPRLH